MNLKTCSGNDTDCIDDLQNMKNAKILLARGECRTYTGSAVENTRDVYKGLGAE